MSLDAIVRRSAALAPASLALVAPDGRLTYGELDALANRLARGLRELGVRPGDRVGLYLEKGARAVAAMQATLRIGAAYVPLDVLSPPARTSAIVRDAALAAVVTTERLAGAVTADGGALPPGIYVEGRGPGLEWDAIAGYPADLSPPAEGRAPVDLAYVLYTSGSTGTPKGVCISHRNAEAFVAWSAAEVGLAAGDRVANHAPFHFDLSVFDLYASLFVGATTHVIPEGSAYIPRRLVEFVREHAITTWYSVPSALILMMEHGGLLEGDAAASLRTVVFAGEPFPVKPLRALRDGLPAARLWNWYGPTETNVCTSYEVSREDPLEHAIAIGKAASGDDVWLKPLEVPRREDEGKDIGELIVSGPTVMLGYWGREPQEGAYETGDICLRREDGNYEFLGRRDAMVKVRGFRVELGEIEAALESHPDVHAAAVVVKGTGIVARLVAFVLGASTESARSAPSLGIIALKTYLADRLPRYMIIDEVRRLDALPRTRNGKVDRRLLAKLAEEEKA